LERIEKEREIRKEKRREVVAYNQQAYRRYNHVKTQGWSPCGLPIHAFSIFNDVFEYFWYYFMF
jgi:hypothetical protein